MLISLLITVIIVGLLFWLLSQLPIPQPWLNIARVILVIIAIIWLVGYLPSPYWGGHRLP